jgi:hypothetical protein
MMLHVPPPGMSVHHLFVLPSTLSPRAQLNEMMLTKEKFYPFCRITCSVAYHNLRSSHIDEVIVIH